MAFAQCSNDLSMNVGEKVASPSYSSAILGLPPPPQKVLTKCVICVRDQVLDFVREHIKWVHKY